MTSSRSHNENYLERNWAAPSAYPNDEPTGSFLRTRTWSDDLLIDGGNHGGAQRLGFPRWLGNQGGDFFVMKRFYDEENTLGDGLLHFSPRNPGSNPGTNHFIGKQAAFTVDFNNSTWADYPGSSFSELRAFGTTAIARTAPTKPQADLGSFIGEAREGFPHAIGLSQTGRERARRARNAGDEYLNVEFGWKPLIRDVQSFAKAVKNSHEILQTYHERSGVLLKRRYEWPTKFAVGDWEYGSWIPQPLLSGNSYASYPFRPLKVHDEHRVERWFTASYQYHVPPPHTVERHYSDANKLLGANLTPNMLWNIAPWSWAADWVGNFGDIAANLTYLNTDSLVIHHAYVMERTTFSRKYTFDATDLYVSYPGHHTLSQTFTSVAKKRVGATPYGFGLNWDGFTTKQLGILAALGISKSK